MLDKHIQIKHVYIKLLALVKQNSPSLSLSRHLCLVYQVSFSFLFSYCHIRPILFSAPLALSLCLNYTPCLFVCQKIQLIVRASRNLASRDRKRGREGGRVSERERERERE